MIAKYKEGSSRENPCKSRLNEIRQPLLAVGNKRARGPLPEPPECALVQASAAHKQCVRRANPLGHAIQNECLELFCVLGSAGITQDVRLLDLAPDDIAGHRTGENTTTRPPEQTITPAIL